MLGMPSIAKWFYLKINNIQKTVGGGACSVFVGLCAYVTYSDISTSGWSLLLQILSCNSLFA